MLYDPTRELVAVRNCRETYIKSNLTEVIKTDWWKTFVTRSV